ncbi:MAG: hypothetical protein Q9208_000858 [Pyrenodesmia sp. 3 TL-2023]
MARFRKWLRGILSDVHERNNDPTAPEPALPPGLPGLPPKRIHVLTPRPSREDITSPQGTFFTRLPSELRDQVFIFAFGDRIVHIDLQFEHPKLSDPSGHLAHAQVYAETINLVYRSNTIHIRSTALLESIHIMLLPQRLATITSLELVWDRLEHYPSEGNQRSQAEIWSHYSTLMEKASRAFPSMRKVYVSVKATPYVNNHTIGDVGYHERQLLEPADALMRRRGTTLRDCQIAPNRSLYMMLMDRAKEAGAHIEKGGIGAGAWHRFWRPVVVGEGNQTANQAGYWVRQGKDDTPLWYFLQ